MCVYLVHNSTQYPVSYKALIAEQMMVLVSLHDEI